MSFLGKVFPFGAPSSSLGFNLKTDFGAVGNGVADDTPQILNWIAAISAAGGLGYAPPGNYAYSDTMVWGNGTPTSVSSSFGIGFVGAGSGGAVFPGPYTGITRFSWIGPSDRPMMKILGPISSCVFAGALLDGNGLAQDGWWEIYMHGSYMYDFFTISTIRAGWFRTRWLTNPSSPSFVEGSSSNTFINAGWGNGLVTAGTGGNPVWGLINGGNPTDPTDRTSLNVSDPYNSVFIKCRFRGDSCADSIAREDRYTDSNYYFGCDWVGAISIGVAQNPNYTAFPSSYNYACDASPNAYTVGYHMQTIGAYVESGAVALFEPLMDANIPAGTYLPWARGTDNYGDNAFAGLKLHCTLQAVDKSAHTLTPVNTSFNSFGFSATKFVVKQGDLYLGGAQPVAQTLKIKFAGLVTAIASATTMELKALIGGVVIIDTGAISVNTSYSNPCWTLELEGVVGANSGTVAELYNIRAFYALGFATSNPGVQTLCPVESGGSSALTNNAVQAIDLQVKFSTSSGNTITCYQATYELDVPNYQYVE